MGSQIHKRGALWLVVAAVPLVIAIVLLLGGDELDDVAMPAVIAVATSALLLGVGWFGLLAPLFSRLARTADAAQRIGNGDVAPSLDDASSDEIAMIARTLDRLAGERDRDERSRVDAETRLAHAASHDPLTGLFNRQHLLIELGAALAVAEGTPTIVMIDLDDFTLLNERSGNDIGDQVLVSVANRLRRLLGDRATIARWSGDEFLALLPPADQASLDALVEQAHALLDEPLSTSAGPQLVSASIATASAFPGTTVDSMIADVNGAVAEVKERNAGARLISPETVALVERALADDGVEVSYQPIVEMYSPTGSRMVGAEALMRLRDSDGTVRSPGDFMGEILLSPLARELDRRMATSVLASLARWRNAGLVPDDFIISLNLSPASLRDDELPDALFEACTAAQVNPASIVLDVSEEAGELDQIVAAGLRQYGFRLSIDDLGLKRSNFDRLFSIGAQFAKLHRRWLDDEVMLDALVSICQRKGLELVAEGVETMEQLAQLYERGVCLVQGYVISRPVDEADFERLLGGGRPSAAN